MESDKLGKEQMGRLIFRMALPTVTAQLVNLLYNIVDRIFIGHIPEIGDTALTGVGVVHPIIVIISAFSAFFGNGARKNCRNGLRKRRPHKGNLSRAENVCGENIGCGKTRRRTADR